MDPQRLLYLIDTMVDNALAQRRQRLLAGHRVMHVIVSGDDLTTLPSTIECLSALQRCGYQLMLVFSHSASQSALQSSCLETLAQRGIDVLCGSQQEAPADAPCSEIFFPALSSNSLSKIALGIGDNLVCRWAFHALSMKKRVIVTLNAECQPDKNQALPPAWRTRLAAYVSTLAEYGFTVIGKPAASTGRTPLYSARKPLITLSDVRQYPQGETLHIGNRTLITPAARDEIRDRGLVIVQRQQEETCIWPG